MAEPAAITMPATFTPPPWMDQVAQALPFALPALAAGYSAYKLATDAQQRAQLASAIGDIGEAMKQYTLVGQLLDRAKPPVLPTEPVILAGPDVTRVGVHLPNLFERAQTLRDELMARADALEPPARPDLTLPEITTVPRIELPLPGEARVAAPAAPQQRPETELPWWLVGAGAEARRQQQRRKEEAASVSGAVSAPGVSANVPMPGAEVLPSAYNPNVVSPAHPLSAVTRTTGAAGTVTPFLAAAPLPGAETMPSAYSPTFAVRPDVFTANLPMPGAETLPSAYNPAYAVTPEVSAAGVPLPGAETLPEAYSPAFATRPAVSTTAIPAPGAEVLSDYYSPTAASPASAW